MTATIATAIITKVSNALTIKMVRQNLRRRDPLLQYSPPIPHIAPNIKSKREVIREAIMSATSITIASINLSFRRHLAVFI